MAVSFTASEYTDMVLVYGESDYSLHRARTTYGERFPNRRQPTRGCILGTVQRLRDTGSVLSRYEGRGRIRPDFIFNVEEEILQRVEVDPTVSTRTLAREFQISHSAVHQLLRRNLLYPYHFQRVQQLTAADYPLRNTFCQWIQQKNTRDENFVSRILFTDECCFTRDGIFNYHNQHHWSDANPYAIRQSGFQWRFSLNIWAGIVGNVLVGPVELPQRLTGAEYLNFLENTLNDLLDDVPLETRRRLWYMHDGAPAHATGAVRDFFATAYGRRWIGRNGPVRWPARSPDLNPLDFFMGIYEEHGICYTRRYSRRVTRTRLSCGTRS